LSVDPAIVELRAAAGTQQAGVFQVINDVEQPVTIAVELERLSHSGYASHSPEAWLDVSPSTLRLGPHEQARVRYVVAVPAEAEGELAAEVVFVQGGLGASSGGIQVRFGMALYVSIAGTERLDLRAEAMHLQPGTPPTVVVPIANEGNVHCRPEGTVRVHTGDGELLSVGRLSRGRPASPGRVDRFSVALDRVPLAPGTYRLAVDLTCPSTAQLPARLQVEQTGYLDERGQWHAPSPPAPATH
jgi:hypothetical protein